MLDLWLLIIYHYIMIVNHNIIMRERNMTYKARNQNIEKIDNNCLHCAYFVKHYANLNGTFYLVGGCKHCINSNLSFKESNKRMSNIVKCEYWEPEQIQIDKRRQSIKYYLQFTANKLNEIAQILKEDNERNK